MTYCCITCEFDKARANNAPGRRNLRPMIPPVAATRDAAAGATTSSVAPVRVPEPAHTRLGDTATLDPVPAPPGRAAGAHDLDPCGPQHTNGWVMSC